MSLENPYSSEPEHDRGRAGVDFGTTKIERDFDEVCLLFDFVSGRPDKHLSDLDGKVFQLRSDEIIKRLSSLGKQDDFKKTDADDASFILLLKDALNSIAYPARGSTIAFTLMFSKEGPAYRSIQNIAAKRAFPDLVDGAARLRAYRKKLTWGGLILTFIVSALLCWTTYGVQLAGRFEETKKANAQSADIVYTQMSLELCQNASKIKIGDACRIDLPDD